MGSAGPKIFVPGASMLKKGDWHIVNGEKVILLKELIKGIFSHHDRWVVRKLDGNENFSTWIPKKSQPKNQTEKKQ